VLKVLLFWEINSARCGFASISLYRGDLMRLVLTDPSYLSLSEQQKVLVTGGIAALQQHQQEAKERQVNCCFSTIGLAFDICTPVCRLAL